LLLTLTFEIYFAHYWRVTLFARRPIPYTAPHQFLRSNHRQRQLPTKLRSHRPWRLSIPRSPPRPSQQEIVLPRVILKLEGCLPARLPRGRPWRASASFNLKGVFLASLKTKSNAECFGIDSKIGPENCTTTHVRH
jgi:hypothetical protein